MLETRDGVEGAWVPLPKLRLLMADHLELGVQKEMAANLAVEIAALQASINEHKAAEVSLDKALHECTQAREADAAWIRSPVLWGSVGLVVGSLLTVLVVSQ